MTNLPADATLTTEGFAAVTGGRVLLLACGALAREILAVKESNGLNHLDLQCLPAIYHNHRSIIHMTDALSVCFA